MAALAVPTIISVQCNYCSNFVHPLEVVRYGDNVIQCFKCRERHCQAVEAFNPPAICVGCLKTWDQLRAEADRASLHVSFFADWRDGEYTLLCSRCDEKYIEKRRDLVRGTAFEFERKLR